VTHADSRPSFSLEENPEIESAICFFTTMVDAEGRSIGFARQT